MSKRGSGEVGYQLDTTIDRGPRTIGFKLTPSGGGQMFRYGQTAMQTNTWYHIAGVYNASTRELHVYLNGQLDDGALVGTVAAAQQNSTSDVNIGRRPRRLLPVRRPHRRRAHLLERAHPGADPGGHEHVARGRCADRDEPLERAERPASLPRRLGNAPRARRLGMQFRIEPFSFSGQSPSPTAPSDATPAAGSHGSSRQTSA